jgi:ferric-dicitrate binding protein FerR (iron transport regulator)
MSAADCQRWIELSDQAAVGQILSEKDEAWIVQHARGCDACAREAGFYSSLRDAVGRPERLVVPSPGEVSKSRRRPGRLVAYVTFALAASLALAVGIARNLGKPAAPPVAAPAPALTAQVLFASGDVRLGPGAAQAGQVVAQGQRLTTNDGLACIALAQSITVCLDATSAATVSSADPGGAIVYLEKGRLLARLDHQPAGRRFLVRTAKAEVQAVGTRFSVGVADDGRTLVRLHEGKVAVRAANRVSSALTAPAQANVSDDIRVAPIPALASDEDRRLSELSALPQATSGATLLLQSSPSGADVLINHVPMGKTPLSAFLAGGAHLRLSLAGYAPVDEWVDVADGARIERTFALTVLPTSTAVPFDKPTHVRHDTAAGAASRLLARAQTLRARGEHNACAQLYRRLWAEFPNSEEAKVSMISLGELELVGRKRPSSALEAFNAYLRVGGPLAREARFGRIRALRALGRDAEADAESATFLRDYSTSIQSTALRRHAHGE